MLSFIEITTSGEQFYSITDKVKSALMETLKTGKTDSGILVLQSMHTSCGLCINESYDPAASRDLEKFLDHLAPRNLSFIEHDDEGEDDSPSHMKSIVVGNDLTIVVEKGELLLGTWQGIYLAEFRDSPKNRKIALKFMAN